MTGLPAPKIFGIFTLFSVFFVVYLGDEIVYREALLNFQVRDGLGGMESSSMSSLGKKNSGLVYL